MCMNLMKNKGIRGYRPYTKKGDFVLPIRLSTLWLLFEQLTTKKRLPLEEHEATKRFSGDNTPSLWLCNLEYVCDIDGFLLLFIFCRLVIWENH